MSKDNELIWKKWGHAKFHREEPCHYGCHICDYSYLRPPRRIFYKVWRWFRHQLDRFACRLDGHWPDDFTDCPENCELCKRKEKRRNRMQQYVLDRDFPQARLNP